MCHIEFHDKGYHWKYQSAHLYSLWSNKQLNGLIVLLRDGGQRPLVNIRDTFHVKFCQFLE